MHIDILTLFPEMFSGSLEHSIIKRAQENDVVRIVVHHIRDYTHDRHRVTDDSPYGGGVGMLLKPEPIFEAVDAIKTQVVAPATVILLSPQGRSWNQKLAWKLSGEPHLILICGRYEGIDERVREHLVDLEISIGDYVLSGGEIAAMVIVDTIVRLLPRAVGSEASVHQDSHTTGLLQYPQYTRPETYRGLRVPEVLLSGNHQQIARWRREQSLRRTWERRPDLLRIARLSAKDKAFIETLEKPSAN